MGVIPKVMQPKHRETLSPWLKSYIDSAVETPLPLLPNHLDSFPSRWPFGKGDLYHWVPLLNRFDGILERFCKAYKLDAGPQEKAFGSELLLDQEWDSDKLRRLDFADDGDRQLVETVLKFSRMLLEHCGNRSIYSSSERLNDLLNTTSPSILILTLRVGSELAQRYQASVKRVGNASRQIGAALLANHYNIDLDRVLQLSLPFAKTPIVTFADPAPSQTPSSSKGKDKAATPIQARGKSTGVKHANDLVALADSDSDDWKSWGDVKVSYYSQESDSNKSEDVDHANTTLPSSPTPLRRSSTMGTPHQTPRSRVASGDDSSPLAPRTPGINDESGSSGQKTFELPASSVLSQPIDELLKRCPQDMSPSAKYETFQRLRVAKALTASREQRQQLLAIRLLAVTNLAYIYTESNFIEKVLRHDAEETRKFQLVYQLAELIHPSADGKNDVPLWLQSIALALLEAISGFQAKSQDVLSALNANVNHGILLYVIRKAVAGMKENNSEESGTKVTDLDEWRSNLFALTLHLSMATRVGSEMVSAGLMDILVDMLNIRSEVAQRHHSMVLAFLDGLIWTYQNAFMAFFNAEGLDAVASLVVDTVKEAQGLMQSGNGIAPDQHSSVVDYGIPYYQQQTLRWLLKFVHHIMSNSYSYNGNTDRLLRNLSEKSDLLGSLREIIQNKTDFGSVVWTNTVTILSDFINNDPTSFGAIQESGMISTYLEAITGRPLPQDVTDEAPNAGGDTQEPNSPDSSADSAFIDLDERPHPPTEETLQNRSFDPSQLACGILPSSEAINVVPQVLNSISLNHNGMKMVVASRSFDSFFEIFESPSHVKCMESDDNLAHNLGGSFDELARHHPSLRKSISNAVIDMVARVKFIGIQKARSAGQGVKLCINGPDGSLVSVGEDGTFNEAAAPETSKDPVISSDGDVSMAGEAAPLREDSNENRSFWKTEPDTFVPYLSAVANFLSAYFANSVLKSSFVDKGGVEMLLDLCASPSLPESFSESLACRILNSAVAQLVEHAPVRALPSLLRRAQEALDTLQPLASRPDDASAYFAPFLTPNLDFPLANNDASQDVAGGTKVAKALLNSQTYLKILADCFFTSRSNSLQFYPANVYDYYLKLVNSIGPVLRGVLVEEAAQLPLVPQHWSFRKRPTDTAAPSRGSNFDIEAEDTSMPGMLSKSQSWNASGDSEVATPSFPTEQEQSTTRFQNYETLRALLHPMIPTTFPLFQSLGKALLPRRDSSHGDMFPRPRQLEIAKALANTVLGHLRISAESPDPGTKHFHYWIIMLHTIHEMMVDHPTSRQNDRSAVQLILPTVLAFKHERGLETLAKMLKAFELAVLQGSDGGSDETSKPKVASFGLKKILDLYYILVSGKYISEASGHFSIYKGTDRSPSSPPPYQQTVTEFRAAILPSLKNLWESKVVQKLPEVTVKRIIDALKTIATGDHEPAPGQVVKTHFNLFRYTDVRFKWQAVRTVVDDIVNAGYDESLVHEAVYRANGSSSTATEYCRAHKAGLAGPRNPIPQEDQDISGLSAEGGSSSRRRSDATSVNEIERMALDVMPDIPDQILGDLVDRSSITEEPADAISLGNGSQNSRPTSSTPTERRQASTERAAGTSFDEIYRELKDCRDEIRSDLVDKCLDVLRAHSGSAMEISELISTMCLRQPNLDAPQEIGLTLTTALSTLALDDEEKKRNGKHIAAYAHLLALLLQNSVFFDQNVENLREKVEEYVELLKIPSSASADDLPPWISYILLVLETMLCPDERPVPVQWKAPKGLDETVASPVVEMRTPLIENSQRELILGSLIDLLPRIGKAEVLATSVLRVLVILTRNHELAKSLGEKKNLQRLFLMVKQLSGLGSDRLNQTKVASYTITVLRHIVEDEETIKQVMRAEIKAEFPNITRNHRNSADVASYLRALDSVALRAPELFVEVSNEMLRFSRWTPPSSEGNGRPPTLVLKEAPEQGDSDKKSETEALDAGVKPSTEMSGKDLLETPKQDSKRPVVENPDGVVHFLLCELINYREVDDKEPPAKKESKPDGETHAEGSETSSKEDLATDSEEKKPPKPIFKAEEHPIFVYRCFLLNCLAELLHSYNRTKVEFINFKRSAPPLLGNTPVKPRSSILNYLIYDLLCQGNLSGNADTIAQKKKIATSFQTQKVLVALVSKTTEKSVDKSQDKFAYDEEPELLFVRKFVLDTILKAYERAPTSDEPLEVRYSRMQCLAQLMNHMIGERDKQQSTRNSDNGQSRSQAQLRRLMYEKGYLDKLTASIAEINLNYPDVKRAVKYILRVLRVLTDTAKELSHSNILPSDATPDDFEPDDASSSSLSELEDDREETPDLYRNSALGMLEPRGEDDESEEGDEDDDEDMYGYDDDDEEMDYDEEGMSDGEDNISDEDEALEEMGEIEGLHGDPGVVEVIMDDDDDDESSSGDEDDSSDDDDEESADMGDADHEVEIEEVQMVDSEGNPLTDETSEWESESDDGEDDDDEDGEDGQADDHDYEAEVQDDDEAHIHGMSHGDLLDNMARAIIGEDNDYDGPDLMEDYDEQFADEDHDDEEGDIEAELDDEEYIYDDDYPRADEDPPPIPSLGWDGMNSEMDESHRQFFMIGDHNRRMVARMRDPRHGFPTRLMGGLRGGGYVDDFRSYFGRGHRSAGQNANNDDGVNPLLRRGDQAQAAPAHHVHHHTSGRLPDIFGGGRAGVDGAMGFLGELMEFLPVVGRNGQPAFQVHITGMGGHQEGREFGPIRASRHEHRRDAGAQEPHQAVAFTIEPTVHRYQEEARMIFGSNRSSEVNNMQNSINAKLTPAAMELEKKLQAEEAERQRKEEEETAKKMEEERLIMEAKAAEEKAAREKKEAEDRAAAERAAAEAAELAAASGATHDEDGEAMEGVEATEASQTSQPDEDTGATGADQPRVMTMIRGEEVDVTELGIDPDYLAALPEEFREEVIAQTVSERRSQAREARQASGDGSNRESGEVFQEFLNALPDELRLEIAQQERQEERRRVREDNRRLALAGSGQPPIAAEMDPSSILLTLPPELRDQVLIEQGEELMEQLTPDMAARTRILQQQHQSQHAQNHSIGAFGNSRGLARSGRAEQSDQAQEAKSHRRAVVQMLDKAGVATLLRLMFISQQGSIRSHLFSIFSDVCENRQNRLEVVSNVLQILQDGSTDMGAVERSFSQLSLKARKHREKEKEQDMKTPQSLKRTLTTLSLGGNTSPNAETSPLLVVQQCLDLLVDLCTKTLHIPWLFLTEHETVGATLKRSLSRKGKLKDSKAHKFAINSLLTLLDRDLVMESSVVMTHLADLLNRVTLPLLNLERRRKEAADKAAEAKSGDGEAAEADATTGQPPSNDQPAEAEAGEGAAESEKKPDKSQSRAKQLTPPVIPPHNLTLVVRIFVARECSSKTFQNTISTIKNLSAIPGAKKVFGQELLLQARQLSENIVSDLDDLLPQIGKATSGTDIQGVALAKFSPGASEQNKLLRVLTALDHLFDAKKKGSKSETEDNEAELEEQDLVTSLYHNPTFSAMWEKLSACLSAIHQRENMLNVATILLPLIESLMVVCKNTTTLDDPSQSQVLRSATPSTPPPGSRTANLFLSFTDDHRRILNELVRNNPKLMSGTFALLVKNPKVLDFDNKRNYFNRSVHSRNSQGHHRTSYPPLQLSVRRDHVFHDSFKSLYFKSGDEIKFGKLSIRFHGEEGVDAGGVTREWFQVLARQMFDPNYALFIPVSSDRTTFHPNKLSGINDEHLMFFKFIGRIIGKALYEGRLLDCFFSRAVYKRILGKPVSVKDMESFDPDYYKSLCWMLDNDITDIITETFSVEDDNFGVINVVDLVPNGRDIAVTEDNKSEYVRLVVEHKLIYSVKDQMENFLKGFREVIPSELISIFNEQELELLISGLPDIDIDDWKSNTEYHNYNPSSQQIQWFWRAVRSFDKEERAKLVQFVTGTSKVPLNGFKELEGMNGINRFNIHRDYSSTDRLPTSHTCFNQLDLPEYESYDVLRSQIVKAITAGNEYFGFA